MAGFGLSALCVLCAIEACRHALTHLRIAASRERPCRLSLPRATAHAEPWRRAKRGSAAGAVWRWIDDEMVWVRQAAGPKAEGGEDDGRADVH